MVDEHLLAQDMNALSVQERNQLYEEVHGISEVIDETPEFVAKRLHEMREALSTLSKRPKVVRALSRAFFLQPNLAKDDNFHLIFLRAERFDPVQAAAKMARYFEHKAELWGEDKLVKRITLEDLGEKEMKHMHWGCVHTPVINSKGVRAFLFTPTANDDVSDWKAITRFQWYQWAAMVLEDEQAQKQGVVAVSRFTGFWRFPPSQILDWLVRAHHILRDFPVKILGNHFCYDSPMLKHFPPVLLSMAGKQLRLHTRTHFGSDLEIRYSLGSYGIRLPPEVSTYGPGQTNTDYINSYLTERRKIESDFYREEEETQDGSRLKPFLHPRSNDVLTGRGSPFRDWPGNVRLSTLVASYGEEYKTTTERIVKTVLALNTIKQIQEMGGRFLERTENGWVIVDDLVAKGKVNQLFRAHVRGQSTTTVATTSGSTSTNNISDEILAKEDDDEARAKRARTRE